jgi:hypothetical protein
MSETQGWESISEDEMMTTEDTGDMCMCCYE